MKISVQGIGWITGDGYGCIRTGRRRAFEGPEEADSLSKTGIFSHPFKNFGRLDGISRSTCYAVALCLEDAGIGYAPDRKQDVGIIGTNRQGSLTSDVAYFRDYIRSGRTLSRGNLFIYTLPSSPLGEAAIHFGFQGPLLYAGTPEPSLVPLLDMAAGMVAGNEAGALLFGTAEEDEAVYFVIGPAARGREGLCGISGARRLLEPGGDVRMIVQRFSVRETEKVGS